jgi:hypothetical protein
MAASEDDGAGAADANDYADLDVGGDRGGAVQRSRRANGQGSGEKGRRPRSHVFVHGVSKTMTKEELIEYCSRWCGPRTSLVAKQDRLCLCLGRGP